MLVNWSFSGYRHVVAPCCCTAVLRCHALAKRKVSKWLTCKNDSCCDSGFSFWSLTVSLCGAARSSNNGAALQLLCRRCLSYRAYTSEQQIRCKMRESNGTFNQNWVELAQLNGAVASVCHWLVNNVCVGALLIRGWGARCEQGVIKKWVWDA